MARPSAQGAGNDENGDGGGEGRGQWEAGPQPGTKGRHGDGDDNGDEHSGDLVREALHIGLAGLRVLNHLGHLGKLGIRADAAGAHHESTARIHGGPGHRITLAHLNGNRFAGEHGGINGRRAGDDDAVGCDLLTRTDDELVADPKLLDRNTYFLVPAEDGDLLGAELHEGTKCGTRLALGLLLEVASAEHERDDARRHLQIDVCGTIGRCDGQLEGMGHARHTCGAEEEGVEGPEEGRRRTQRDQGVHGSGAVLEVHPGSAVEWPTSPHDHRGGKCQRGPLPVGELQCWDHCHEDDGDRENGRPDEALAQRDQFGISVRFGGGFLSRCALGDRKSRTVSRILHGGDESKGVIAFGNRN